MNSNGRITNCVVPLRLGVLSLSSTCPTALNDTVLAAESMPR